MRDSIPHHSAPSRAHPFSKCDEAHRVAGPVSSDFGTVLDARAIPGKRRLFMTATPRRFTNRIIDAAKEADFEIACMDDETKFGRVFHRLSFGEAIERDLLTDYQVVVVGVDDATCREYAENGALVTRDGKAIENASSLAGQIGLAQAMRKYDLRRLISFHSRVKRAREFAAAMPEVIDWMPARLRPKGRMWSDVATGEMPAGDRYRLLQQLGRLNDADRGLLANARCLSEGVDVPTLDGVAFVEPRRSEVDIVQAVGRAIRKSSDKTVGTIVIPVFVDTNTDPESALDSSVFKPVWDVIKALRAHDDELGRQLDDLRREISCRGGTPRLPGKIHVDLPESISADFARAFGVQLVERTTPTWVVGIAEVRAFAAEHGHADVPARYVSPGGHTTGSWVSHTRTRFGQGQIAADLAAELESIRGWVWSVSDRKWSVGVGETRKFAAEHGHAVVPLGYRSPGGHHTGRWVIKCRRTYSAGQLTAARIADVESIPGWSWDPQRDKWSRGVSEIRTYAKAHGNTAVPQTHTSPGGHRTGDWAINRRQEYVRGSLSADRIVELESIPGWTWDVRADWWVSGVAEVRAFAADNGHTLIPDRYVAPSGHQTGRWVGKCRRAFTAGELSAERISELESLPRWAWRTRAPRRG